MASETTVQGQRMMTYSVSCHSSCGPVYVYSVWDKTDRHTDRHIGIQANKHTDRDKKGQGDNETNTRQKHRQTETQPHRETYLVTCHSYCGPLCPYLLCYKSMSEMFCYSMFLIMIRPSYPCTML